MTIEELAKDSSDRLLDAGYTHGEREAYFIISRVFNEDSAWIISHYEDQADDDKVERVQKLIKQRLDGCPLAYILGEQPFLGWKFISDKRGLIPRPETEYMVEMLLKKIKEFNLRSGDFLEIGTGSGPIAISLKMLEPHSNIIATDVSPDALELAQQNATAIGADIEFLEGDLFEPVKGRKFDVIAANLPYVPTERLSFVSDQVLDWEPMIAIEAGSDGLKYIEPFIKQLPAHLKEGGIVMIEMWHDHGKPVTELANLHLRNYEVIIEKDLAGYERYAIFLPL